jgi:hypothetical protein
MESDNPISRILSLSTCREQSERVQLFNSKYRLMFWLNNGILKKKKMMGIRNLVFIFPQVG